MASFGDRAGVELGTLAVSKGNLDAVRMLGSMMVLIGNIAKLL